MTDASALARRLAYAAAALGCALRLFHYLRDPAMWHDEAALVVNVLTHDFAALLGPLDWHEAGPPLFLWLERAVALTLGDSTLALRLVPVAASCFALVLFAATARRLLGPWAAVWAVLLVAVSDRLSWHASEAKPYAIDVLVACGGLFAAVRLSHWPAGWRFVVMTLVSPVAIWMSYPACFVAGALLLHELPVAWRGGRRHRLLYSGWGLAVVGSFALLYFGPIRAQHSGEMEGCWLRHFPDWSRPWSVPQWTLFGVADVMRYCFKPFGFCLLPVAAAGALWLWRAGRRGWLIALLGPLALAWAAALMRGYPFGGSRLEVFAIPGLAVVVAAGVEPVRQWCRARWRWGAVAVLGLLATPAVESLRFVVSPWPRADTAGAAEYILAHCQPGDAFAANHWEFAYYFRHEGERFRFLEDNPRRHGKRLWVAFTTPDAAGREGVFTSLRQHGRVLDRREFAWTSVWLLDMTDATTPAGQPPPLAAR